MHALPVHALHTGLHSRHRTTRRHALHTAKHTLHAPGRVAHRMGAVKLTVMHSIMHERCGMELRRVELWEDWEAEASRVVLTRRVRSARGARMARERNVATRRREAICG